MLFYYRGFGQNYSRVPTDTITSAAYVRRSCGRHSGVVSGAFQDRSISIKKIDLV
jgi:hypothetical protein